MNEFTKNLNVLDEILTSAQDNYFHADLSVDIKAGNKFAITLNGISTQEIRFSGNKMTPDRKQKTKDKKERYTEIELIFDQSFKALKLFIHKHASVIYILGKRNSPIILEAEIFSPNRSIIKTYYKRRKKIKVLNACFMGTGHAYAAMDYALASCHTLLAVDTNCKTVKTNKKVAVTTAMLASATIIHDGVIHFSQEEHGMQSIMINPQGNPEIFGIGKMLFRLFEERPELRNKQIGVITDTEYDLLEGINKRTVPFYENFYLPNKTTLFYSSSDVGSSDFFSNKLIKMCDKASTNGLNKYLRKNNLL